MRMLLVLLIVACSPATTPSPSAVSPDRAAPPVTLDAALGPLRGLVGTWQGTDPDRHSTGRFTLEPELGGKVLVRHSRNDSPQGHHDDLMIMFAAPGGLRASYFDNEGHVIQYAITPAADHIELVSDEAAKQPRFRLRYELHGPDELAIDFAMAMPGAPDFQHYTGGVVHRIHDGARADQGGIR
jgi:hypothetical protein